MNPDERKREQALAELEALPVPEGDSSNMRRTLRFRGPDEIPLRCIDSIEDGEFVRGEVTLIGGDGGTGKGMVSVRLAARYSMGKKALVPDTDLERTLARPVRTLFVLGEDTSAIWRLRLQAYEHNPRMIKCVSTADRDAPEVFIDTPDGIQDLVNAIEDLGTTDGFLADLVVVDSLSSVTKVDMNKRQEIRPLVKNLQSKIAQRFNCSVILIVHLRKGDGRSSDMISGSKDLYNAARCVYLIGRLEQNGVEQHYIFNDKANLGRRWQGSLAYEIREVSIDIRGQVQPVGKVVITGRGHMTANQFFAALGKTLITDEDPEGNVEQARRFLLAALGETGWAPSKVTYDEAERAGITEYAYRRAIKELGIASRKRPGVRSGKFYLFLSEPNWEEVDER